MNLDERARRAAASTRLQAERVDTDALLDRVRSAHGRRRWLVPAVAAAGIAIVAAAVVLPRLQPDGIEIRPEPGGQTPSLSESARPSTGPSPSQTQTAAPSTGVGTWSRVDPQAFAGTGGPGLRAVATTGGTVIAVGSASDGASIWRRDPQRPPEDPTAWQQVGSDLCGEASCELHDVAFLGDRFVVVGALDGLPKAWSSDDDGRSWQRIDLDRASDGTTRGPTTLTAVAQGDPGLVAFGSERAGEAGSRPVVFTSGDGQAWIEVPVDFDGEEAGAHVVDAAATTDGRVLAVGYVGDGTVLWEERDGTWMTRHLSETDREFGVVSTVVTSIQGGAGGALYLTGSAFGADDQDGRVWRSTDGGATWQVMSADMAGPGAQQVHAAVPAGGSLVAAGWTSADPQGSDPRPAAWILGDDGWRPMDGRTAFEDLGAIRAAVAVDGHSAVAVGTVGGGGFDAVTDASSGAAIWTYDAETALPEPAADPTGVGECSAAGPASEPTGQPGLPVPVADMRRAIHRAAVGCDLPALADLAMAGSRGFTYSFGDGGDPARYWLRLEEEGAQPLRVLTRVLDLPHVTVETQFTADEFETIYVWPSAYAGDATDADWDAVVDAGLLTDEEARRMREELGGYLGHRVGITADGEWVFFVAGD